MAARTPARGNPNQNPMLQFQQATPNTLNPYATPSRTATSSSQTSGLRSDSTSQLDGPRYVAYSNPSSSANSPKYAMPPNSRPSFPPLKGVGAPSSYSPLELSDIRPRAATGLSDPGSALSPRGFYDSSSRPSNSNHMGRTPMFAFDWCKWPVRDGFGAGKIAVGSYQEDPHNCIQILDTEIVPNHDQDPSSLQRSSYSLDFSKYAEASLSSFPITRILWEPLNQAKESSDLLASSGDHLRLWSLPSGPPPSSQGNSITSPHNSKEPATHKLVPLALLSNSKTPEYTAPLTSLDWNLVSPSLIITSSIDTTCTIWDIPTLTAKTQLIAHDKEVFDVRFCANTQEVFLSCGADGSVRMFDLRSLEHSTIIYEPLTTRMSGQASEESKRASPLQTPNTPVTPGPGSSSSTSSGAPLLRLATSPHEQHYLATFAADSNIVRILDIRQPGQAILELRGHSGALNCVEWSPHRRGMLASGADDCQVFIYDLVNPENRIDLTGSEFAPPPVPNGTALKPDSAAAAAAPPQQQVKTQGPAAAWRCDYEVNNLSWTPRSQLSTEGDWLGVCAGRGIWGVKLS